MLFSEIRINFKDLRLCSDQMVTVPMVAATQINEVETIVAEVVQETMPDIVS